MQQIRWVIVSLSLSMCENIRTSTIIQGVCKHQIKGLKSAKLTKKIFDLSLTNNLKVAIHHWRSKTSVGSDQRLAIKATDSNSTHFTCRVFHTNGSLPYLINCNVIKGWEIFIQFDGSLAWLQSTQKSQINNLNVNDINVGIAPWITMLMPDKIDIFMCP